MSKYRDIEPDLITVETVQNDIAYNYGFFTDVDFITKENYISILDDIESEVKNITCLLEDVKGIDLIDDVVELLEKLEKNLY